MVTVDVKKKNVFPNKLESFVIHSSIKMCFFSHLHISEIL